MKRQIIVFDTTTGDILRSFNVPPDWTVVCSGNGAVDGNTLFGSGFLNIDPSDTNAVIVTLNERTMRCGFKEVVSDTELTFIRTQIHGDVTYEILKRSDPKAISDANKLKQINEIKVEVGHSNVDALKIKVDQWIDAHNYFVDIADGNKIKRKDERITYE